MNLPRLFRSAFVIARRDFTATVMSKTFLIFLLGPLFPVLAGVARMPYGRFLVANITGALTWGAGLVVLGHLAASTPGLAPGAAALAGAVVAGSLGWAVLRLYRQRSARRR